MAASRRAQQSSTVKLSQTAQGIVFRGLAVARETRNVYVHAEKERERMKCSLANSEGLVARIENLGNLGQELDQTWRALFGAERPRRVCDDLLSKAVGYRLQRKGNRRTQTLSTPIRFA